MKKITTFFATSLLASIILTTTVPLNAYASTKEDTTLAHDFIEEINLDLITPYSYHPHPEAGGGFETVYTQYGDSRHADSLTAAMNAVAASAVGEGIRRLVPSKYSATLSTIGKVLVNLMGGVSGTRYYTVTTYIYPGTTPINERIRVVTEIYSNAARTHLISRQSDFVR